MIKRLLFGLFLVTLVTNVIAQGTKTVKGKVTAAGKALANVNVTVAGTSITASTDAKGQYKLTSVPKQEQTLEFSLAGYKTKSEKLPKATTAKNVSLEADQAGGAGTGGTDGAKKDDKKGGPGSDSLPIRKVNKSLRFDGGVDPNSVTTTDRIPLEYENLRADDAVFRHKIWREIDCREKINAAFTYSGEEDNGDQHFISILMNAIQDGTVTAFKDDRFTEPYTIADVAERLAGPIKENKVFDSLGNADPSKSTFTRVNSKKTPDSYKTYLMKEEVIFDKESSKLFWRILGIAPVDSITISAGAPPGNPEPLFWVYFPDVRPVLAKYDVYNPKNMSARMSWDDLFQLRMFSGRIIKSTMDNVKDKAIAEYSGLAEKPLLQLFEAETIKEKIFNYEQDQWSY